MDVKFSVITVCLNVQSTIRETIQSVLNQTYENYEIIVKDGESTDNTLSNIPISTKIRIISKKDTGIYNAMNEAVRFATGDYYIFLNAGDLLYDNYVFEKLVIEIKKNQADVYYGDYYRNGVLVSQPDKLSKFTLFRNPLNHQSMFFRRDICTENEWYNENFHILADYDLTVRSFIAHKRFVHVPIAIDKYEGNGISESSNGKKRNQREMTEIRKTHFHEEYLIYNAIISLTFVKVRQWIVKDTTPKWITRAYRKFTNLLNR